MSETYEKIVRFGASDDSQLERLLTGDLHDVGWFQVTSTDHTPPQTAAASTFEPDWIALGSTLLEEIQSETPYGSNHTEKIVRSVIAEYRHQMSEAGLVVVRADDVYWALMQVDAGTDEDDERVARIAASLVAAQEETT